MGRNITLGIAGLCAFFLVLSVLYTTLIYTENNPDAFVPFAPFIFLSGFFIFLVGAILVALYISKILERK